MATKEDVLVQFEMLNINPPEDVLSKCLEMCLKYNVSGEDLVDQWFAYTTSNLKGAAPTLEHLERMERKEFMKKLNDEDKPAMAVINDFEVDGSRSIAPGSPDRFTGRVTADLSAVVTPKGKNVPNTQTKTPVQDRPLLDESMDASPSIDTQSQEYTNRTDALTVRCSYNNSSTTHFQRAPSLDLTIRPLYEDFLKANQPFMFEIMPTRAASINSMIENFFNRIEEKFSLILSSVESVESFGGIKDDILLYGRILSNVEGRPNPQSLFLEQTRRFNSRVVALNLSGLTQYSLYPGQVVAVKGTYLKAGGTADKLLVKEIFADTDFKFAEKPVLPTGTLQLVIACGPFTTQDNLTFEPLNDLVQYVKKHTPHVLLLVGPFYQSNYVENHIGELHQTVDSFFSGIIDKLMNDIPRDTRVIVVSSLREPHHFPVYPTPPYQIAHEYDNLVFMPDPCLVDVNGVLIGATSADILFDLGRFELNVDKVVKGMPDRMGRLVSHLFKQQSFYPLLTPGKNFSMDFSLMQKHGVMTVKPQVMILPSNLRHFIKEIDDCLVINPERLTKGNVGGCFATLEISSGSTQTVIGRSSCQVLKI